MEKFSPDKSNIKLKTLLNGGYYGENDYALMHSFKKRQENKKIIKLEPIQKPSFNASIAPMSGQAEPVRNIKSLNTSSLKANRVTTPLQPDSVYAFTNSNKTSKFAQSLNKKNSESTDVSDIFQRNEFRLSQLQHLEQNQLEILDLSSKNTSKLQKVDKPLYDLLQAERNQNTSLL